MSKTFSPKITVKIVSGDYVMGGAVLGNGQILVTDSNGHSVEMSATDWDDRIYNAEQAGATVVRL